MAITNAEDSFQDAEVVLDETAAQTKELAISKFENFTGMEEILAYSATLLQGKLLPTTLKTPESVASIILMGRELSIGPMTALSQLVTIQGRVTLSVHAIGLLLRRAGIAWKTVEDFVPIMGPEMDKQTPPQPTGREVRVDMRTTIRFYRKWQGIMLEEDASFSWRDAEKMELSTKDNWRKQASVMCWSRCFAKGARRVAPDALLGAMETSEWADVSNKPYTVDGEGEVTLL